MKWVVFSYSLSSKSNSSARVSFWRRLRRLGAISLKTGVYVLPAKDECIEAFQWLAQEIRQAQGEALTIYVESFDGLNNAEIIELFCEARRQEYAEVDAEAQALEATLEENPPSDDPQVNKDILAKLRKRYAQVQKIDFFNCLESTLVSARLAKIEQALSFSSQITPIEASSAEIKEYAHKTWVTRPRLFVDRLACIWLIRRFINPNATIRYCEEPTSHEVAFDMPGAEFGHSGNLCSFETMLLRFNFKQAGLQFLAEIVHELDLRDGRYEHAETAGVEAILRGWLLLGLGDLELESRGILLLEGLYTTLSQKNSLSF